MGKLSGEFRKPNRKDKVTRFPSVTYARQLGILVNTLGSHLKRFDQFQEGMSGQTFYVQMGSIQCVRPSQLVVGFPGLMAQMHGYK